LEVEKELQFLPRFLNMYGPEKQIIDGKWKSPAAELVK
jgi:hypothetical protein